MEHPLKGTSLCPSRVGDIDQVQDARAGKARLATRDSRLDSPVVDESEPDGQFQVLTETGSSPLRALIISEMGFPRLSRIDETDS